MLMVDWHIPANFLVGRPLTTMLGSYLALWGGGGGGGDNTTFLGAGGGSIGDAPSFSAPVFG